MKKKLTFRVNQKSQHRVNQKLPRTFLLWIRNVLDEKSCTKLEGFQLSHKSSTVTTLS